MDATSARPPRRGLATRAYAAVVVALRHVIPLAWIAVAVAATVALPGLGDAPAAPLDDLAAKGGSAASAQALATRTFGFPLATDTAVVQRDARGLSGDAQRRQVDAALAVRDRRDPALAPIRAAVPLSNAALRTPSGERGTTAITYLMFAPDASLDDETAAAQHYARQTLGGPRAAVVGVTGAAPAREAQFHEIEQALPLIEAASVVLIALIVALAFRSVGAPLVALAAAGIAYAITMRVLPWLGERSNVTVPKEIEPVVVVLLLGLVTDYSIFFLSEMRRRRRAGDERLPAARGAIAEVAPIVLTAGLIVAAGTAALVVGHLQFFRAFGPGLAATTLVTLAVAVTLVPALVALFGPRLFGKGLLEEAPRGHADTNGGDRAASRWASGRMPLRLTRPVTAVRRTGELAREHQTARWRLVLSRIASSRPVALPIALVAIGVLAFAATNVRSTELGLGLIRALPAGNEVRRADDAASRGFAPGIISPTEVDLVAPGIAGRRAQLARLQGLVAREDGVAAVVGPREQPPPPAPQVSLSRDGGGARLAVVLDSDPLGAPAIDHLRALRDRMPNLLQSAGLGGAQVVYGGQTALADDTVSRVLDDLARVAVVAVLVNVLLLALFMRALVAPLYLVASSILGLLATLGLTTLFFQHVLGQDDLTYYVPFAAAVLLVALGSDYNVFVAGRIWDEARRMRLREAIAVAAPQAARAVTVAGLALAASFALLAIVPLRSFREFAFVMGVGVLVDTFVVRTLLVPALTSLFGERAWWPGRRVRRLSTREFLDLVSGRAGLPRSAAHRATDAALVTLSERITPRETQVLAAQLPRDLRASVLAPPGGTERFGAEEFVRRVGQREGVDEQEAAAHTRAVLLTLGEAVAGDLDYVRAQLSADYAPLFDGH
jgi:putative drug exporter of the RND superfamily